MHGNVNMSTRAFCFEYRIGIEGEAAAAAALRRSEADIVKMEAAMHELERLHHASHFSFEADFEFHLSVARATNNNFFVRSLETMKSTIRTGMVLAIAPSGLEREVKGNAILDQHQAIFHAIVLQDDTAARDAMRQHLSRCHRSTRHWDGLETLQVSAEARY
jgi:DNA-binding FadR family transcriptional regulator